MQASLRRFTNSINADSLHSVYPKRIETTPASFLLQDINIIFMADYIFVFSLSFLLEELMKKKRIQFPMNKYSHFEFSYILNIQNRVSALCFPYPFFLCA